MPLLDYKCPDCGHVFEQLTSLHNTEAPPCPRCGGTSTRRNYTGKCYGGIGSGGSGCSGSCAGCKGCGKK